ATSSATPSCPRAATSRRWRSPRAWSTTSARSSARCVSSLPGEPDHRAPRAVEQVLGAALVDVADQPAIQPEPGELAQPRRERARDLERDPELLVLLLPHPAGAVVHR